MTWYFFECPDCGFDSDEANKLISDQVLPFLAQKVPLPGREALVQKIATALAAGKDSGGYDTLLEMYAHIALTVIERASPQKVEGERLKVSDAALPYLFEALEDISHDSGARAGHAWHTIAPEWAPFLRRVETALKELNADDRNTLAIGEQGEADEIAARSPELGIAHVLFHDFFENDLPDPTEPRAGLRLQEVGK